MRHSERVNTMIEHPAGRAAVATRWRRLAVTAALTVGGLCCACSSSAGASTGVLKGIASPCTKPATFKTAHAWTIKVVLRRGTTVVSTKTVLDTQAADAPVIHGIFTFTEPPGSYSISGPTPNGQTVVIKAGATSTVDLSSACP
jgi:hypothetical protein